MFVVIFRAKKAAQQLGKQAWYANYRVEICKIQRSYSGT
jgi:hypothetical protein